MSVGGDRAKYVIPVNKNKSWFYNFKKSQESGGKKAATA